MPFLANPGDSIGSRCRPAAGQTQHESAAQAIARRTKNEPRLALVVMVTWLNTQI